MSTGLNVFAFLNSKYNNITPPEFLQERTIQIRILKGMLNKVAKCALDAPHVRISLNIMFLCCQIEHGLE